jgi:hypothetical protein
MKKLNVVLMLLTILFLSCNSLKTAKTLKNGSIKQTQFTEIIDFKFDKLIKINVEIKGKQYTFIFDTGAGVSVLSESAAKALNLTPRSVSTTADSQGNKSKLNIYVLDSLKIGNITFLNHAFAGADLTKMGCYGQEFDGIIGANLMCKAIWYIDNDTKKMTITNDKSKLVYPSNGETIKFTTKNSGVIVSAVPIVAITIPELVTNQLVEFDMGSSNGFSLNKKIVDVTTKKEKQMSIGNSGLGLLGRGSVDTTFYVKSNEVLLDKMKISDSLTIRYKGKKAATLGMDFLKNYNILLDWTKNEITMCPSHKAQKKSISKYGFKIDTNAGNIEVVELFKAFEADKKGIQLGDKILKINRIDFEKSNETNFCDLLKQFEKLEDDKIIVTINRNNERLNVEITKIDN